MKLFRLAPIPLIAFLTWAAPSDALDLATFTPFTAAINCSAQGGGDSCDGSIKLPSNRTIVLEYVSVACAFATDEFLVRVALYTTGPATFNWNLNVPPPVEFAHQKITDGGQVVSLYPAPGSELHFFALVAPDVSTVAPGCTVVVSGQQSAPAAN